MLYNQQVFLCFPINLTNMNSSHKQWLNLLHFQWFPLIILFLCTGLIVSKAQTQELTGQKASNNAVEAVFVFGDSTADPGNNNHVTTIFKGDFAPYGRDFPDQVPTGRFSNGRLGNDFIASYVGVKEYVPAYLDPTLSIEELMTGVSFASAACGFDPLTPRLTNVVSLPKQLEYFKEYQKRVDQAIGTKRTKKLVKNALYVVSTAGTNDFVVNYFTVPIRRKSYSLPSYMEFVLQQVQEFIQDLLDQGARRIGVVGLPPMGCLPIVITLFSDNPILNRGCLDFYSAVARQYNIMLKTMLIAMQSKLLDSGVRILYIDAYGPLSDMIIESLKYNFDEVSSGCCGTGVLETSFLCNPGSYVCPDASKYVFFDSIHPSEAAYKLLFEAAKSDIDFLIAD